MTYKIEGYESQEDFDNGNNSIVKTGLATLRDALKEAGVYLFDCPIVEVISDDEDQKVVGIVKRT